MFCFWKKYFFYIGILKYPLECSPIYFGGAFSATLQHRPVMTAQIMHKKGKILFWKVHVWKLPQIRILCDKVWVCTVLFEGYDEGPGVTSTTGQVKCMHEPNTLIGQYWGMTLELHVTVSHLTLPHNVSLLYWGNGWGKIKTLPPVPWIKTSISTVLWLSSLKIDEVNHHSNSYKSVFFMNRFPSECLP